MTNPKKYVPAFTFTTTPAFFPAPQLNVEFLNLAQSIAMLLTAVLDVRRSDGQLANGVVTLDSLAPELRSRLDIGDGLARLQAGLSQLAQIAGANGLSILPLRFSDVAAKPTTLAGFGIQDAYTRDQIDVLLEGTGFTAIETQKGRPGGIATLNAKGKVPNEQLDLSDLDWRYLSSYMSRPGGLATLDDYGRVPLSQLPPGVGSGGTGSGGTGATKSAANIGSGSALFANEQNNVFRFRSLVAGSGVTLTYDSTGQSAIRISAAGQSAGGSSDAANINYFPTPTVAVPVAQRLGQEVHLTDGYVEGSNLSDFSDLIEANLARALAIGRPFVIPQGKFTASRQFTGANRPVSIFGYGKMQSGIEWTADAASVGLAFTFDSDDDYALFEDFSLFTKGFNAGTALQVDFTGRIVPNNGNPVIFTRFQPCGRARDLLIRGTDGTLYNGFQRGICAIAPIAFHVQDCDLWGASTGTDPNYASEEAIYIGNADGYGHPVECLVQNNRTYRWKKALLAEGMEGVSAQNNQFVGVGIGVYFKDTLGRPHLNVSNNHINAAQAGVVVENCAQFTVAGNCIYLVTGAGTTGSGVVVQGASSHWGSILNNDFEDTDSKNASSKLNAIVIDQGSDITIDQNRFRRNGPQTISGIWLTSRATRVRVGNGNVFTGPEGPAGPVDFEVLDQGADNLVPGHGARYTKSVPQSCTAGTPTTLAFQVPNDVRGNMPSALGTGSFTVLRKGVYQFTAGVVLGSGGIGGNYLNITRNGTTGNEALASDYTPAGSSSDFPALTASTGPIPCDDGDVIRVVVNPGATRNALVRAGTFFNIRRLS